MCSYVHNNAFKQINSQVKWTFLQWQPSCQKAHDTYTGMYNI